MWIYIHYLGLLIERTGHTHLLNGAERPCLAPGRSCNSIVLTWRRPPEVGLAGAGLVFRVVWVDWGAVECVWHWIRMTPLSPALPYNLFFNSTLIFNLAVINVCLLPSLGLPWWISGKESKSSVGDTGDEDSIPGSGRFSRGGNGLPFTLSQNT